MDKMSLKEEIDAEIQEASASHRKKVIFFLIPLCIISFIGIAFLATLRDRQDESVTPAQTSASHKPATTNTDDKSPQAAVVNQEADSSKPSANSQRVVTPPPSRPANIIDRSAFKAAGNKLIAEYVSIIELVTFPAGMSDTDKTDRIARAYALERQYFNNASKMRAILTAGEGEKSQYLEIVNLAESAASSVSVGIEQLNVSSASHDSVGYTVGMGSIEKGTQSFSHLSQKVNSL